MLPPAGTPGADLPVRTVLPELTEALRTAGAAVLVAPPGTGKTTLVPLALAGLVPGRVLVAEPRRVAARAAASRMAALVEADGGAGGGRGSDAVGYTVRGATTVGPRTRVEVVTTGVLVRRLQNDPELPGVDAVVIDECHERHLDTDLALAFGTDVRSVLRPDLLLLAMSATAQADLVAQALGGVPVVRARDALHPVSIVWCPPGSPLPPAYGLRVDPRLLDHVADVVRRAHAETEGDLLVFLPGVGEVLQLTGRLRGMHVVPLHGRLTAREQDEALRPADRRRVVLATAVAESSLTVPGVRTVVDAGLSRVPRTDLARGLGALVTVPVSQASAEQRAGRAGREAPGRAYRCWSSADHARLPAHAEPEVATADLTSFLLELACWGAPEGRGLALLDALPAGAVQVAGQLLRDLGAVDATGSATHRGRALAGVGTHPRLARALFDAAPLVGTRAAAEVAAVLSDETGAAGDMADVLRALRQRRDPAASARWREQADRLARAVGRAGGGDGRPGRSTADREQPDAIGLVVGLAFPQRLARLREPGGRTYLMAGGTAAQLPTGSVLAGEPWLAVAVADRSPGHRDARVRLAAVVDEELARQAGSSLLQQLDEVVWRDGDVRTRRVERLGAIVLGERPLPHPDPEQVRAALAQGLREDGLGLLRWTASATSLRARLAACHAGLGEPWPDVGDASLLEVLDLSGARSRADLHRIDLTAALRSLLPWQVAGQLDQVAPERLAVPSGGQVRVDYTDPDAPVLPVRVQEVFGWGTTPQVAGRPVRLHLLSPASRVVAVTSDLASFWTTGYPGVRADLRGRYPRHAWPEDPATATPSSRPRPRS